MNAIDSTAPQQAAATYRKEVQVRTYLIVLAAMSLLFLSLNLFGVAPSKTLPLWIAWASLVVGILIGFVFSATADEKKFSPAVTAVNGLLGGALLTDLAKGGNSLVLKVLRGASEFAGYHAHGEILIAALMISFLGIGFLAGYFIVKVDVNVLIADSDQKTAAASQLGKVLADHDPTAVTELSPEIRQVAEHVLRDDVDSTQPATMLERGLALLTESQPKAALSVLEDIPQTSALYPEAQTYLAYAYLNLDDYERAAKILDRLVTRAGGVPSPFAWKLLGYAYLFLGDEDEIDADKQRRLKRSVQASRAALNLNDRDAGALLNLACAYGQLGPENIEARADLFEVLSKLFQISPNAVNRVKKLSNEEDFDEWKMDPQFQMALTNPATYQLWLPPPTGSWKPTQADI